MCTINRKSDRRTSMSAVAPALVLALLCFPGLASAAPGKDDEEELDLNEVVVTGSFGVRQGGAQDASFFRNESRLARIPHPRTLTFEGLLGDHDIRLPAKAPCDQLFCITAEVIPADLPATPEVQFLAGIGFNSNVESQGWQRRPLNLVAVVDKSGSMDGQPLDLVRKSLTQITQQLRVGDQISIVLYGDTSHVLLPPTYITDSSVRTVLNAIGDIRSAGSTSMEAGLTLGYDVARTSADSFRGTTRVMLFTDERPNTDRTDAGTFMGMAERASREGIGLTTIGVGVQFGAELATTIGSVRGGNLYFIGSEAEVGQVFEEKLDFMVSELAHDLKLTIRPAGGFHIAAVYGVPNQLMGWQSERNVTVTVPTVFLSTNGGGLFVALVPDDAESQLPRRKPDAREPLADLSVDYLPAASRRDPRPVQGHHQVQAFLSADAASDGIRLGHLLVDEFTSLRAATAAHYQQNDQESGYRLVRDFRSRLDRSTLRGLEQEKKLLENLLVQFAFLSGHGSEVTDADGVLPLWGRWTVLTVKGDSSLEKGMTVEFSPDGRVRLAPPGEALPAFKDLDPGEDEAEYSDRDEEGTYTATDSRVYAMDLDGLYSYRTGKDLLKLRSREDGSRITLQKEPVKGSQQASN